ncbi:phosphoglycerate mutase family protein [Drepanopeziza brunnea f. sp. 'multigermtubi' MB_m1]|uniref:Phosphoglycerate mutase family protein n=1 Tax=Marssonina brunnea f. sp. multigermtubi (strain MB_m1) TaxID=1072389 RepID=K1WI52_MARBU|nr:phosphoglycerate mutase family protein [Drepanopeziza brunnea f. sp. 'multigermtubi' MB_m1]EKD17275.1 phosphoglycerate mutase family protein [Drepanopeziza brunnea f. sp. 'multigermtubi' MB_m1]
MSDINTKIRWYAKIRELLTRLDLLEGQSIAARDRAEIISELGIVLKIFGYRKFYVPVKRFARIDWYPQMHELLCQLEALEDQEDVVLARQHIVKDIGSMLKGFVIDEPVKEPRGFMMEALPLRPRAAGNGATGTVPSVVATAPENKGESNKVSEVAQVAPSNPSALAHSAAPALKKGKTFFHFIRHAQAACNLRGADYTKVDPELTDLGMRQAEHSLAPNFPPMAQITHILVSPMRRTMKTMMLGLAPALQRGIIPIAWPALKELGDFGANTGITAAELQAWIAGTVDINMKLVGESWGKPMVEDNHAARRARAIYVEHCLGTFATAVRVDGACGWAWQDSENEMGVRVKRVPEEENVHVAVVSHGALLRRVARSCTQTEWKPLNTEFRSFEYCPDKRTLIETEESNKFFAGERARVTSQAFISL